MIIRSGSFGRCGQQQPGAGDACRHQEQHHRADGREKADQEPAHCSGRDAGAARRSLAVLSWPQAARMSLPRGVRTGAG